MLCPGHLQEIHRHSFVNFDNDPSSKNNGDKVSCSKKQRNPLVSSELKPDRHQSSTTQTSYPLCHTINKNDTQSHLSIYPEVLMFTTKCIVAQSVSV